jgi:hypothetical protein
MVKTLRKQGHTYRQIALEMTSIKIRSKSGKVKWHPMMVKRLLESGDAEFPQSNTH